MWVHLWVLPLFRLLEAIADGRTGLTHFFCDYWSFGGSQSERVELVLAGWVFGQRVEVCYELWILVAIWIWRDFDMGCKFAIVLFLGYVELLCTWFLFISWTPFMFFLYPIFHLLNVFCRTLTYSVVFYLSKFLFFTTFQQFFAYSKIFVFLPCSSNFFCLFENFSLFIAFQGTSLV
jgi:hypothetical protein